MVKIKLNDIYKSYFKGNLLMLATKFGYINMVCLLVLLGVSVALYLETAQTWCFIMFGAILAGFIIFGLLHLIIIPLNFNKNEFYADVNNVILIFDEDEGMTFEGYKDDKLLRTINVYWDDIEKIVYRKNYVEIILPEEIFYLNREHIKYLEGSSYIFRNMLKRNVDRHIFKHHIKKK